MPYADKAKQAGYQAKRDKDTGFSRQRFRRSEVRRKLREYKKTVSCSKCPESHPACIDFHHADPSTKKMEVCEMPMRGYSWETILAEIEKCEVLCRNCHAKEHWSELF